PHRFEEDERKRINVRRGADLAERVVELLGGAVGWGEDADLPDGVDPRADVQGGIVEDLRDAEVEHLHLRSLRRRREEEIARVEIAMNDALAMGVAEPVRGGPEELHDVRDAAPLVPDRSPDREFVR